MDFATSIVLATDTDIASFEAELDVYEDATVAALMANEEAMTESREAIDGMLAEAHVLDDGTRVFKTKDGMRVFAQDGTELPVETVDPNVIPDWKPSWEAYSSEVHAFDDLAEERKDLLQFQSELDDMNERLDDENLSQDALDRMRDRLAADAPNALCEHHPDLAADDPQPTLSQDFGSAARDMTMPSMPGLKPETLGL